MEAGEEASVVYGNRCTNDVAETQLKNAPSSGSSSYQCKVQHTIGFDSPLI